jgi:hypothetical protein
MKLNEKKCKELRVFCSVIRLFWNHIDGIPIDVVDWHKVLGTVLYLYLNIFIRLPQELYKLI